MSDYPARCPVHADPEGTIVDAWSCPDECGYFLDELNRRIAEASQGHYIRAWRDEDGVYFKQEHRFHEPVGDPVRWEAMNRARPGDRVEDLD